MTLKADIYSSYAVVVCVNSVFSLTRLAKGLLQSMKFYSLFFLLQFQFIFLLINFDNVLYSRTISSC